MYSLWDASPNKVNALERRQHPVLNCITAVPAIAMFRQFKKTFVSSLLLGMASLNGLHAEHPDQLSLASSLLKEFHTLVTGPMEFQLNYQTKFSLEGPQGFHTKKNQRFLFKSGKYLYTEDFKKFNPDNTISEEFEIRVAYDGQRAQFWQTPGLVNVSRDPEKFPRGDMQLSPMFVMFSFLCQTTPEGSMRGLTTISLEELVAGLRDVRIDSTGKVTGLQLGFVDPSSADEKKYSVVLGGPSGSYPIEVTAHSPGGNYATAKVNAFLSLEGLPLPVPQHITISDYTSTGQLQSEMIIEVDANKKDVFVAVNDQEFTIPASAAVSIHDLDLGVWLKRASPPPNE